jgi:hypothetical protein
MLEQTGVHTAVVFSNSEEHHNFPRKVAVCSLIIIDSWTKYILVYTKVLPTPIYLFCHLQGMTKII